MKQRNLHIFFISFVAALGGFLFGYDLVVISGAVLFLKKQFALTSAGLGFATASAILGCIAGPLVGGWLSDRVGRKKALLIANALFAVSAIGTALPRTIDEFNFFRVIGGIGCGLASVASPMYIAEIAPAVIRGRLMLMYQLAIVVGAFASTMVAYFLSFHEAWRWMFASELVPVLIFGVLLLLIPRSPRWLVQKGRLEEAREVLEGIDGPERSEAVLKEIQESILEESGTYSELLQPGIRTAFLVAILLAVFNQWTGWTFIAYYLPILFQKAGFEEASEAIFQYLVVNGINIILTLVSLWLVDRVGPKAALVGDLPGDDRRCDPPGIGFSSQDDRLCRPFCRHDVCLASYHWHRSFALGDDVGSAADSDSSQGGQYLHHDSLDSSVYGSPRLPDSH